MSAKIIAVANHKGGCGKTTTVVHLASELANIGKKIGTVANRDLSR